jgi:hypothetical protein
LGGIFAFLILPLEGILVVFRGYFCLFNFAFLKVFLPFYFRFFGTIFVRFFEGIFVPLFLFFWDYFASLISLFEGIFYPFVFTLSLGEEIFLLF